MTQLAGSFFLCGPAAFGKKLISREMRFATFLYFGTMVALLIVCYVETLDDDARLGIAVLLIIVCYACMVYFAICMLPFGKRLLHGCCASYCSESCRTCEERCSSWNDKYCTCWDDVPPREQTQATPRQHPAGSITATSQQPGPRDTPNRGNWLSSMRR